ncbi:MAG: winged helix-turn-helix transcriptional regulator [Candidatus Nitrospinota bacterium M3_3B_026]
MSDTRDNEIKSPYTRYKNMADEVAALQILEIIGQSKEVSQRKITRQTGLAAGLVSAYMRRVIGTGWVKARQVSARRWLYYLTPEGFVEKSRLTLKYLAVTFQHYHHIQELINGHLDACVEDGRGRVVVAGANELAEIAALNILACDGLELAGVVDGGGADGRLVAGRPVEPYSALDGIEHDRLMVCDISFIKWWNARGESAEDSRLIHLGGAIPW